MQTVSAIMLLLGCSHDVQICEPAELDHPYYESIAQCESDISAQEHYAEGYPLTVVKCIEVDQLSAKESVKIEWHFNTNGVLIAYAGPVQSDNLNDPNADVQLAASGNEETQ